MTLTAPAIELRPNSVPCGPLTTSARSTSYMAVMTPPVRPDQMPSTNIETEGSPPMPKSLVAMPRIASASVNPSSVLPLKPGVKSTMPRMSAMRPSFSMSPVKADTERGTSCSDCWRFCAVITTSSRPTTVSWASAAACGAGAGCSWASTASGHDNALTTAQWTAARIGLFIFSPKRREAGACSSIPRIRSGAGSVQAVDDCRQRLEDPVHVLALDDERRRHREGVAGGADQEPGIERRDQRVITARAGRTFSGGELDAGNEAVGPQVHDVPAALQCVHGVGPIGGKCPGTLEKTLAAVDLLRREACGA